IVTRALPGASGSAQSRSLYVPANSRVSSQASGVLTKRTGMVSAMSIARAASVTTPGGALITACSASGTGEKGGRVVAGVQAVRRTANAKCEMRNCTIRIPIRPFRIPHFEFRISVRMRRCSWWVRVCRVRRIRWCGVLLAFLVRVPGGPVLDLGLERLRRNACRVLKHHPAAQHSRPDESRKADNAQRACERQLLRRHLETARHLPEQDDGEEAHRQERHRL